MTGSPAATAPTVPDQVRDLATRSLAGDRRALSRLISLIEQQRPEAIALLEQLRGEARPQPRRVGITGAPGAGKSTLTSALIRDRRRAGRTVGVVAVDPSSPFSAGALLGDRLRMDEHLLDPGVFVRSMSARGQLGGLSAAAPEVAWLLGACGFDEVIVETVGTGQSELDLRRAVDTTVLVLTPAAGDGVQVEKAGIVEIADVFVVNKADLPGAPRLARDLRTMLGIGTRTDWVPPIVTTVATDPGADVAPVWAAIEQHRAWLDRTQQHDDQARALAGAAAEIIAERARAWALRTCAEQPEVTETGGQWLPLVVAERLLTMARANTGRA